MIKKFTLLLTLTILSVCLGTQATRAQRATNSKARVLGETYFSQDRLLKALQSFDKHEAKKNTYLDESFLKIKSQTYFKLGRFEEAVDCYARIQENPREKMDTLFFQGLVNRSADPFRFGSEFYSENLHKKNIDIFVKELFTIQPFHVLNSKYNEFAPVEHKGKLYFSTNRNAGARGKEVDDNTNLSYYDVYEVAIDSLEKASHFDKALYKQLSDEEKLTVNNERDSMQISPVTWINSKYNDGPISFWNDSILFATRNERYNKRDQTVFNLNIYKGKKPGMSESNRLVKTYFGDFFSPNSVGHITFSPDGKRACMSAESKTGKGRADLYFSNYSNKRWGRPVNAGSFINTKRDELFPFWSDDGYIYFSSDGHQGFGGLDVFRFNPNEIGAVPMNVGQVVNSEFDDFSFSINKEGIGFLSSNRKGGQGKDDIYKIEMNRGTINVELVCEPDLALDPWFEMSTPGKEKFESFNIAEKIKISYPNLPYGEYTLHHILKNDTVYAKVGLYSDEETVYVDFPNAVDSLIVRFSNFRFDEHSLSEINQENFQKLVKFLKNNIDVQILIKGHTDQFGSVDYNQKLGSRRCDAMEEFLRQRGVKNFIEKESFGRSQLVSDTDHRLNRRVDVELRVPGSPKLLTFVPRGERGQKVDMSLSYDNPKEFDQPLDHGFYIKFFANKVYHPAHQVAARAHLPRGLKTMIFSESNYIFRHYVRLPFDTKAEADKYAKDVLHLSDYEIQELEETKDK